MKRPVGALILKTVPGASAVQRTGGGYHGPGLV